MSDNTMDDLWTAMPNHLIALMPKLGPPATMIVVAVARKTLGWQKESDVISISQFIGMTGLSRQGTIDAVEKAIKVGAITRTPDKRNGFRYRLVNDVDCSAPLVNETDQSTTTTSQRSGLPLVNDVDCSSPPLVNDVDTQKKDLKKRKKDLVAPVGATPPTEKKPAEPPTPASIRTLIADLCSIDLDGKTASEKQMRSLNAEAKKIWAAAQRQGKNERECCEAIKYVASWIKRTVYPYSNGQPITPSAIRERWKAAMDAKPKTPYLNGTNGVHAPALPAYDYDNEPNPNSAEYRASLRGPR